MNLCKADCALNDKSVLYMYRDALSKYLVANYRFSADAKTTNINFVVFIYLRHMTVFDTITNKMHNFVMCNFTIKIVKILHVSILYDSVEIPTRCSFVIEFILSKFIEGSTCFERHTSHHKEL